LIASGILVLLFDVSKEQVGMTAIVHTLFRSFHSVTEADVLKQIALLCGAGLLVSLLLMTYGLDLSPGFF
jgi:hypothetical protein